MATLHGYNGRLYLGTTHPSPIAELTDWSIEVSFDTVDDSAMGDAWETTLRGPNRFTGSMAGNYNNAATDMFDIATSLTSAKMYLYPDNATNTNYYYGNVWADLSITGSRTDKVTIAGTITGNGALTTKP